MKDITLLDSWVISAQEHFNKNTEMFPGKNSNNLYKCPVKAVVGDAQWEFTTKYMNFTYSNGTVVSYIVGLEVDLLIVVLQQMILTFVPTPEGFETEEEWVINLIRSMVVKEYYIIIGNVGNSYLINQFFSSTNTYYMMSVRWYVPCSVKYPRWSSIFRVLSVALWLVLIISIVIVAISTTFF